MPRTAPFVGWRTICVGFDPGPPFIHETALVANPELLGDGTKVWAYASIHEGAVLGQNCSLGERAYVGAYTIIGNSPRMGEKVHITDRMTIGSGVFIAPLVCFSNDKHPVVINPFFKRESPIVEDDVSIGVSAVILPGVRRPHGDRGPRNLGGWRKHVHGPHLGRNRCDDCRGECGHRDRPRVQWLPCGVWVAGDRHPHVPSLQDVHRLAVMPGTIGIPTGEFTRFAQFGQSLAALHYPPQTYCVWTTGGNIARNCNRIVAQMRGEWVWFIGDDHAFHPDILTRLLEHQVDVVVPLCAQRTPPYSYGVYDWPDEQGVAPLIPLDHRTGLVPVAVGGWAGG